ncbi:MAG: CheR family methyltransferase [Planctomycetota bacterium]|jgi:chemotaxis protein methyltransferase CheR
MSALFTQEVTLTEEDFQQISRIVYDHCGINLHDGKKELIRARLAKKLRAGNFNSFPEYLEHIQSDKTGRSFSDFIDVLSTNLTSFFRENQHFEYVKNVLLPRIIDKKRKTGNQRIRVWSAGCSSGEEPYSIAITLLENLPAERWDAKILATDISTRILEKAKAGLYAPDRVAPVSLEQKRKYLTQRTQDGQKVFEVGRSLREMIRFGYLNLMTDWPISGPLDFIFCRNVMIYFDKPTQASLVNRYWNLLDSGGVLFTGHSESLTGIEHKFKYVQPTIYMKP